MHLISLLKLKIYALNTMINKFKTNKAPKPVGNYPHAVEVNGTLYLSGIGPRDNEDNSIPGNQYDQSKNHTNHNLFWFFFDF